MQNDLVGDDLVQYQISFEMFSCSHEAIAREIMIISNEIISQEIIAYRAITDEMISCNIILLEIISNKIRSRSRSR